MQVCGAACPYSAPAELGPATLGPDVMLGPRKCPAVFSDLWVRSAGFSFSEQGEGLPPVFLVTYLHSPQVCEPHLGCAQSS